METSPCGGVFFYPSSLPTMNVYETDTSLREYLLFHYGTGAEQMPWPGGPVEALGYPERCVSELLDPAKLPARARALDVGCAVGRSTFELARHCHEVVGIDYSASFIEAANALKEHGELPYAYTQSGAIVTETVARVPADIDRSRVAFEVGDAQDLRDHLGAFDCLLAANLLCRLERPMGFLERLPGLLNPGGQLLLCTPQTWLEDYTQRKNWVGATPETGTTFEALQRLLDKDFALERRTDLPFLIREHARKYQWSVAEATVWTRR